MIKNNNSIFSTASVKEDLILETDPLETPGRKPNEKPEIEPEKLPDEEPGIQPNTDPGKGDDDDDDDDDDPFKEIEIGDDPDKERQKIPIM